MSENKDYSFRPTGKSNYGSIGHLIGSRTGPTDSSTPPGQAAICNVKVRDKHDKIIVQEKLDGSNVGVARINDSVYAITRDGFLASKSDYLQHRKFAEWVEKNQNRFKQVLNDGERLAGEWLLQAHGTKYKLDHEPFVAFDVLRLKERMVYDEFLDRVEPFFITPNTVHIGGSLSIIDALSLLGQYGGHGATEIIEGAVWRVERNELIDKNKSGERKWKVDFLAKYVRPDKEVGKYLPRVTGNEEIWNEFPDFKYY